MWRTYSNPDPHGVSKGNIETSQVEYENDGVIGEMYEYELSNVNKVSVKSKLQQGLEFWKSILVANSLVCNTLEFGYVIPFVQNPLKNVLKIIGQLIFTVIL